MSEAITAGTNFVKALFDGDPVVAHQLLDEKLRNVFTDADLAAQFAAISEDMGGITGLGEAVEQITDWPGKADNELAMVYVPLEGDTYSEAITVTVARVDGTHCISGIEWGRP